LYTWTVRTLLIMDSNILQHFRKDEEPLISQLSDYIMQAENEYRPILTHFLNPREQYIAQSLIHKNQDVKVSFSGGYENAERKLISTNINAYTETKGTIYCSVVDTQKSR